MLRFLHGSDFHLDAPFRALAPDTAAAAQREQYRLLERFAALAERERVDVVFLAGNLFDELRVSAQTLAALWDMFAALRCPVFLSPGSLDFIHPRAPYARFAWPEQVHIFRSEAVEAVALPELGCTVYGAAFEGKGRSSSPLKSLQRQGEGLHIGCFHAAVTTEPQRQDAPIHPDALMGSGLHYLALGGARHASGLLRAADTYYAYPGVPQGRSFEETGEKSVYLGEITAEGQVSLYLRPMSLWQYQILPLDVTGRDPVAALAAALPPKKRKHIIRLLLAGEAPEGGLDLPALRALLQAHTQAAELVDGTLPNGRSLAQRGEASLAGLFLRAMEARMEAAPREEEETLRLALRLGLSALEGREAAE